jgi:hypothetical protein
MRTRVIARRNAAARPHRRARCAFALAGTIAVAAAPAPAAGAQIDVVNTATDAVAPAAAVSACAAAVAEPGTRARAALRAALRCAVNAERTAHGLATLRPDPPLNRAARRHARDIVRRHYFATSAPARRWPTASRPPAGPGRALPRRSPGGATAGAARSRRCAPGSRARRTARSCSAAMRASGGSGLALGTPTSDRCGAAGTWVLDVAA